MNRYWSPLIHQLTPYQPGEQPQLDNLLKLNTNENPYPPSDKVLEAIRQAANSGLRTYPDPQATELKRCIAEYHNVEPENVFVGNSSDEVLAHTFQALLKQDKPLYMPDISYSFYPVLCKLYDIDSRKISLHRDFSLDLNDYDQNNGGVIIANPNAPTGMAVSVSDIESFLQLNSQSVLVVDEAYVDFCDASSVRLTSHYPNLLIVQTLSKSRSLAGLRVGLALGHPELIDALERVKNSFHPYALSRLALAGAQAAIEDQLYFQHCVEKILATRDAFGHRLQTLGFTLLPSAANFVFVKHPLHNARDLFHGLRQQGIVVRHFDTQRLHPWLRISIGTDADMQRLGDTLEELIE